MAIKIDFTRYENLVETLEQANSDYMQQLSVVLNVRNAVASIDEPSAKIGVVKLEELAVEIRNTMDTLGNLAAALDSSVLHYKKVQDNLNKKIGNLRN